MRKRQKSGRQKGTGQPCLRHLEGHIGYRSCTNNYNCEDCEFEQFFMDHYRVHAVVQPVQTLEVRGFAVPQGYYFHRGHTWARVEEDHSVRVGLDDFALKVLGPFDRFQVPLVGKEVRQAREDITVFRGDQSATVCSPISGVVTALNLPLLEDGHPAGDSPYTEGWLMTVHAPSLRSDLKNLMINEETKTYLAGQVDELFEMIEETLGPMANDGGHIRGDLYGEVPSLGWDRLTRLVFSGGKQP